MARPSPRRRESVDQTSRAPARADVAFGRPLTAASGPQDLRSVSSDALEAWLRGLGQPAYRTGQILDWIHRRHASHWDEMTNLPRALREAMAAAFTLQLPDVVRCQGSRDTTRKFLWRLGDGSFVESVLIPANPALYGEASDRHTLCVSTQVGCAYGCRFCASGLEGWKRNLTAAEIIGQIAAVERHERVSETALPASPEPANRSESSRVVNNLVIMGMGEPLANYDALLDALRILNAPWGGGIGARKITISTSGLAPQIRKLAREPLQFRLAISLHGATDAVRSRIMPVNRKYPLQELVAACEEYRDRVGRMITLEYILIAGVNDAPDQVQPLAALAKRLHAKVNLIPYNQVEGLPWIRPEEPALEGFLAALEQTGVTATLRREKGHDIDAACGQLRLRTERELSPPTGPGRP